MTDFAAEGLLDGLEGQAREERLELLRWLEQEGFAPEVIREASEHGLLPFLPAERAVMGGHRSLTAADIAQRLGADPALLDRLRRAMGLPTEDPDALQFGELDLQTAGLALGAMQLGYSEEQILAITRVLGRGLSQAAQVMRASTLEISLRPGATERELAEAYEAAVEQVAPALGPMVEGVLRAHLRNMVRAEGVAATERARGAMPGARTMGVAFADLVGFTRLGEQLAPEELGRVAERLADIAGDLAVAPVRMVKTIGDAAMLVCDEDDALVGVALDLVDAVEAEGESFPQVRVGLARGPATQSGGDWFGRPVNLASRITTVARTGSVLAAEDVRESAAEAYRWSYAGERRLRGISAPVKLYRARRLAAAS